ncbi:ArgP/LysG family DNA-binding transcriptional regulator [Glutamicibacter arilaitensis]|uniref:ArgP/LysG family DNA-binding transcriptional regulator n=1 Tax=Glutamicibacter arilaitensis TaxID=256701 RepID=UPI00384F2B7E
MNLDLEHLDTLLAVVDAGSFDDASIDLGVTPSAISQRIKALESRLGSILLVRSRPVKPTEQGSRVLRYARQISLLGTEFNHELMRDEVQQGKISLSIGVNSDSLATWFSPVFSELAKWPQLSCEILRTDENRTMDLLRTGRVSGVVTNSHEVAQGCSVQRLGSMRYRAVAAPSVLSAWTTQDLSNMPIVLFDREDPLQHQMLTRIDSSRKRPTGTIYYVPDSSQFVQAIRAGMGWGMVPEQQLSLNPELRILDDSWFIDVPLYWQRWSVDSPALDRLGSILLKAAERNGLDLIL